MTALDNIKAALVSMCRAASMHDSEWTHRMGEVNDWGAQCWEIDGERVQELATAYGETTAAFIAACNPTAIRELLAYVESLEKDAGRWRTIRKQHEECDSGITMCVFQPVNGESLEPVGCMPGELDAAVDAIGAAMEQTK